MRTETEIKECLNDPIKRKEFILQLRNEGDQIDAVPADIKKNVGICVFLYW